ncbi:MAG: hypothetical protein GX958_12500 [Desulfitobacterium sp.]|nr:hypothetical protein [Desulfitobacterium sp.]
MFGGPRQSPQVYPSNYERNFFESSFSGNERNTPTFPGESTLALTLAASNTALFIPAGVGTGAFFILTQLFRIQFSENNINDHLVTKVGSIIYTGIVTGAIAVYIYNLLISSGKNLLAAFVPFTVALWVMLLYYASVYNWIYRLDPSSFSGEFGERPLDQIISFIYFSITTFSTAGMGNLAPITKTARILVAQQILFFVFIFTMGMVFFVSG